MQITLRDATAKQAYFQLEPREELEIFGVEWVSDLETVDRNTGTDASIHAIDVAVGDHLVFVYRGRIYRLGLLSVDLPFGAFDFWDWRGVLRASAMIRVIDGGPYSRCVPGGPKREGERIEVSMANPGEGDRSPDVTRDNPGIGGGTGTKNRGGTGKMRVGAGSRPTVEGELDNGGGVNMPGSRSPAPITEENRPRWLRAAVNLPEPSGC